MTASHQAVVLCGGLGTRIAALAGGGGGAEPRPKVLLDVAGRPFLDRLLDRLHHCHFDRVHLCLGHLGHQVRAAVALRSSGPTVSFSEDGERLLGTAGALRAALDHLDATFLVTYGDSYLPFDYRAPLLELEARPDQALGCMAVFPNRDRIEPSNASVSDGHVVRYDKARRPGSTPLDHIDYGAIALDRRAIAALDPHEPIGLDTVQAKLAAEGRLLAYIAQERFYEIGSPQGLEELRRLFASHLFAHFSAGPPPEDPS